MKPKLDPTPTIARQAAASMADSSNSQSTKHDKELIAVFLADGFLLDNEITGEGDKAA